MTNGLFLLFLISSLVYGIFGWFLIPRIRFCIKPSAQNKKSASGKRLSIIIPARNEEHRLPVLLSSLKNEGAFEKYEVILADDQSCDNTAAIAKKAGCRIIKTPEKPAEAVGKSWACAAAAEAASGEILMFLDADVNFLPSGIEAVLSRYTGGLLSVQPYHRFSRLYESLSAFFNLLAVAGVNSFSLHSSGRNVKGAFGPCMVCSISDYRETGGHRAIMDKLVDDLALAKLFHSRGLSITNLAGKGCIEYRMYPEGIRELWRGWTKNMALASSLSSKLTGIYFGIWCAGVANLALTASFADGRREWAAAGAVYAFYALQLHFNLRRIGSWNILHSLLFPLKLVFFFKCTCCFNF